MVPDTAPPNAPDRFIRESLKPCTLVFSSVGSTSVSSALPATVAGCALLTEVLPTDEKTKVQGFSDSLMNLSGALGGAVSGTILLLYTFGGLNAAALIPVVFIVVATSFSRRWRG